VISRQQTRPDPYDQSLRSGTDDDGAKKTLEAQIANGTAKVDSDPTIWKQLASTMVDFDPRFKIIPGTKAGQVAAKEDPYEATDVRRPIAE
jgi:hypothetical protein